MKLDLEIKTENLKNMNKKKIILIAMGDSGGHIYPAFAIAERLEDRFIKQNSKNSLLEIHFVHTGSNLSSKLLSSSSYFVHKISIGGLAVGQSFLIKIKTLLQLPMAFFKAIFLIRKIKPAVIFGTGGSVTFPVLIAGFFMRKKIAIWEANTCLGLANKMLAPFVFKIFTVFPKVKSLSPKKQIGSSYPLRKQIKQANNSKLFSKDKFKILVLGGSQGSLFLNKAVHQALQDTKWREEIFIYHQTGDKSFDELDKKYKSLHGVSAFAFSTNIQNYYKECDLIFSRAGSGSIAEIAYFEKTVVLIPLTYSAGGHQFQNALSLSSQNCVEMIAEKDFNSESFKNKVLELKKNRERRKQLAQNLKNIYQKEDRITPWIFNQLIN